MKNFLMMLSFGIGLSLSAHAAADLKCNVTSTTRDPEQMAIVVCDQASDAIQGPISISEAADLLQKKGYKLISSDANGIALVFSKTVELPAANPETHWSSDECQTRGNLRDQLSRPVQGHTDPRYTDPMDPSNQQAPAANEAKPEEHREYVPRARQDDDQDYYTGQTRSKWGHQD